MAAIRITGSNTKSGVLTMMDSSGNSASTLYVHRGEVVTWEIQRASGVSGITKIEPKPDNQNIFSLGPKKLGNSINWQGKIAANPNADKEAYIIAWNDSKGVGYKYDPLIQLNP